jgi:hypothetical protein
MSFFRFYVKTGDYIKADLCITSTLFATAIFFPGHLLKYNNLNYIIHLLTQLLASV